jgi:membrane protein
MRSRSQNLWNVLKDTFTNWSKHSATTHSAALAYVSLFSIAPALILVIAIAGAVYGEDAARGEVQRTLAGFIGPEGATMVQDLVAASAKPRTGRLAAIISIVTVLVTATGALIQLQDTLNTLWEVTPKPGFFLKRLLLKRLLCFGLILGAGVLVLASIAASAALSAVQRVLEARLEIGLSTLLGGADVLISLLILPDVELSWREVFWGSALTAALFLVGKYAIGFYLAKTGVTSTYGAAGSLVLILVWIYYSSLIFLLGAEFTRIHSRRYRDGRAEASPGAVRTATVTVPLKEAKS